MDRPILSVSCYDGCVIGAMMRFSVDTHLFRELGEYLVGRDSTALAELVKNAYDADATSVTVYGELLSDAARGFIEIQDNGVGMTAEEFENGFLRIASRIKEKDSRHSARFNRRYTGAKGIGRLAAHKLARHLEVTSVPSIEKSGAKRTQIQASIDWDLVEACESLEQVGNSALSVQVSAAPRSSPEGTTIRLSGLRQDWTKVRRASFISEVRAYQPPPILDQEVEDVLRPFAPLFGRPTLRKKTSEDPGFLVALTGDFEQGDEPWQSVLTSFHWVLEVSASQQEREIAYLLTPTWLKREKTPEAEQHRFSTAHPAPEVGPSFQARVFVREGSLRLKREDKSGLYSGIRLYLEGFRVLPYGEPRNDWLGVNADYSDRETRIAALRDTVFPDLTAAAGGLRSSQEGLSVVPAKQYLGGVFLTQEGASSLRMVVNREGFEPDPQLDTLVESIRTGIGLLTRVRAFYNEPEREKRRERRASTQSTRRARRPETLTERSRVAVEQTRVDITKVEKLASEGKTTAASALLVDSAKRIQTLAITAADSLRDQSGMVLVAASVGLQMGEFVHEIRSAVSESGLLVGELNDFRRIEDLAPNHRKQAAAIARVAESLARTVEWLARSLDEISTIDKRRRRSRQLLRDAFDNVVGFTGRAAARRSVEIENRIDEKTATCPMFRSELFSVILNVLSNAIKFAGEGGRVLAAASTAGDGTLALRVENTGEKVDVAASERLFRPFESTSTTAEPALGQGLGLGLPITRSLLEEYGASIGFADPSQGFATAIEIRFPK